MVTGLTLTPPRTLTVLYDRDCGVCTATALALIRLDQHRRLTFEPLQTTPLAAEVSRSRLAESLHVVDAHGRWYTGGRATAQIARRVPALAPVALVARLPGALTVLDLGYRLVAAHRHRISAWLGLKACPVPPRRR